MKTHAQAVVIGGGLIGCSILYHLTKLGWRDVVLLERDELTSGSTWHAAANIHGLHDHTNIARLQFYTMKLYAELEKETGQSTGLSQPGTLYLAQSEDREHQLRITAAKARRYGFDFHEIGVAEARQMNPLINFDGIRTIMFEPEGGNVDPSGVTHAYAKGARQNDAEIYRFTPVTATVQRPDGGWTVTTPKGSIETEVLINAAGLWAREVGRMAGIDLPLIPMEHQYLVTETLPEIAAEGRVLPTVADRDGEYYLRQEGMGLLVGFYEKDGKFWAANGTPVDFGHELFDDDLDRIAENYANAIHRIPALEKAGIKRVINGPMIWSPDGNALFGPVPELKNYYCCNGIIPGFSQSGGLGSELARWIVEGETELDMFAWDLTRYGAWADRRFTMGRALDTYAHRFKIHFPTEERAAARPVRTRPVYQRQRALGAVFGLNYGWEHPQYFTGQPDSNERYGFARQPWWHNIRDEAQHLRNHVGVIDISNFGKYRVRGAGAGDWLDRILANKMPRIVGRSVLSPLLSLRGGLAGEFTVSMLGEDDYFMIGSGAAERYHARFFQMAARPDGVVFTSLTDSWVGFNVAGPRARDLLSQLTNADLSNEAFPFFRSKKIQIGGVDVVALRVSFTGDLGWELHTAQENQATLYEALLSARDVNVRPVGARTMGSLRVEKGYGTWGHEYSPEYWPHEVGYAPLVKTDKPEFIGRDAYLAVAGRAPRQILSFLTVPDTDNDAVGQEPIFAKDGTPIGHVTSGGYSHSHDVSIALAMIKTDHALPGTRVDVAILGRETEAVIMDAPIFDPKGVRLRG